MRSNGSLIVNKMELLGHTDSDDELEISMEDDDGVSVTMFANKSQAYAIVGHLTRVFEL